jgi:hypothetical protein
MTMSRGGSIFLMFLNHQYATESVKNGGARLTTYDRIGLKIMGDQSELAQLPSVDEVHRPGRFGLAVDLSRNG